MFHDCLQKSLKTMNSILKPNLKSCKKTTDICFTAAPVLRKYRNYQSEEYILNNVVILCKSRQNTYIQQIETLVFSVFLWCEMRMIFPEKYNIMKLSLSIFVYFNMFTKTFIYFFIFLPILLRNRYICVNQSGFSDVVSFCDIPIIQRNCLFLLFLSIIIDGLA